MSLLVNSLTDSLRMFIPSAAKDLPQYIKWQPKLITLDHPWNFFYDEIQIAEDTYLKENSERANKARKNMLLMVSEGAFPVLARDI